MCKPHLDFLWTGTTVRLTLSSSVWSPITRLAILLRAVLLYPFLAAQNPGHKGESAGQGQAFRYCLIVLVLLGDRIGQDVLKHWFALIPSHTRSFPPCRQLYGVLMQCLSRLKLLRP